MTIPNIETKIDGMTKNEIESTINYILLTLFGDPSIPVSPAIDTYGLVETLIFFKFISGIYINFIVLRKNKFDF
eukprot:gene8027-12492_t